MISHYKWLTLVNVTCFPSELKTSTLLFMQQTVAQSKHAKSHVETSIFHGCSTCLGGKTHAVSIDPVSMSFASMKDAKYTFPFLIHKFRVFHIGFEHLTRKLMELPDNHEFSGL